MRKRTRIEWIVGAVVIVVAIVWTIVYLVSGALRNDNGINLVLVALWVAAAIVLLLLLLQRSRTREEMVRRFYVSDEGIYNHELGYVPFSHIEGGEDVLVLVTFAADALAKMSYGYDVAELPADFVPKIVITTNTLRYHSPDNDEENGVVIDKWEGQLLRVVVPGVESSYELLGSYRNARELAYLLDENGAL